MFANRGVSSDFADQVTAGLWIATPRGNLRERRRVVLSSRAAGLLVLAITIGSFLGYMVHNVPIVAPRLSRSEVVRYWHAAAIGAIIVAGFVALVCVAVRRRCRSLPVGSDQATRHAELHLPRAGGHLPRALCWQRVPRRVVLIGAAISLLLVTGALLSDYPLWTIGLAALLPWVPVLAFEAAWKLEHYGVFAVFLGAGVLPNPAYGRTHGAGLAAAGDSGEPRPLTRGFRPA